jgi:hypothetical protein
MERIGDDELLYRRIVRYQWLDHERRAHWSGFTREKMLDRERAERTDHAVVGYRDAWADD